MAGPLTRKNCSFTWSLRFAGCLRAGRAHERLVGADAHRVDGPDGELRPQLRLALGAGDGAAGAGGGDLPGEGLLGDPQRGMT
jgi:hypothetical protein